MLADKDRMPIGCASHRRLFPVILWLCICQALADDLCCMHLDHFNAFLFDIRDICFLQLKTAPEIRLGQTLSLNNNSDRYAKQP